MRTRHCEREAETVRAAWGRTPGADPDLAAHLSSCQVCAEIALLAGALREDREASSAEARPPAAAVVWWRAQRRARDEAARRAAQPIALVHAVALGCAAAAAGAVLSLGLAAIDLPSGTLPFDGAWTFLAGGTATTAGLSWPLGIVLLLVTSIVFGPVAIYLALSE